MSPQRRAQSLLTFGACYDIKAGASQSTLQLPFRLSGTGELDSLAQVRSLATS